MKVEQNGNGLKPPIYIAERGHGIKLMLLDLSRNPCYHPPMLFSSNEPLFIYPSRLSLARASAKDLASDSEVIREFDLILKAVSGSPTLAQVNLSLPRGKRLPRVFIKGEGRFFIVQ